MSEEEKKQEVKSWLKKTVIEPLLELHEAGWVPPTGKPSVVSFVVDKQVWLKQDKLSQYIEMGFTTDQLDNLFVKKIVGGKVVVSAGRNGKHSFPVSKVDLQVSSPEDEDASLED